MTVRTATTEDCETILGISERSFQASYSLSPEQIETIVEEEFGSEPLTARIEDPESLVVVAESDGEVVGFADANLESGTLRWLHVDPMSRGQGFGTALTERVTKELADRDHSFTAQILDEATEGESFLEQFGLNRTNTTSVAFRNLELSAHVYSESGKETDPNEPVVAVPETIEETGRPVDRDEPIPGVEAPFFVVYTEADSDEQAGYFCSNCGSTDVSIDGMDRLECGECGNKHLADEWDDAYL